MYAMKTIVINKKQEEVLRKFERKITRTILDANITDDGHIQRKTNVEIVEALDKAGIVRQIKVFQLEQFPSSSRLI